MKETKFFFFIRGLFFKNTIGKFECTCIYHSCIYNIIYFLFLYLYEYNINDFKSLWLINVRLIVYRSIEKKNTYGLTNSANKKKYAQQWWDKKKMYFIPEISTMINRNKITRHGFLLIKVMTFCSTALACIQRSHISRQCFSYLK